MRRIILSLTLITLTVAAVGGSAYALFSNTVKVQGITLSTGDADLDIGYGSSNFLPDGDPIIIPDFLEQKGFFPGEVRNIPQNVYLKNSSESNISLKVTAHIPDGGVTEDPAGSWDALKDMLKVRVENMTVGGAIEEPLSAWNSGSPELPGAIPQGEVYQYKFTLKLDSSADNNQAGKALKDIHLDIVGTQQ